MNKILNISFTSKIKGCILTLLLFIACIAAQAQKTNYFSKDRINYSITRLTINSDEADYFAMPYRKGFVFCSNRNKDKGIIYQSYYTSKTFSDLYYCESMEKGKWDKPKPFSKNLNSNLNEGPFTFNEYENVIYFTSNDSEKGTNKEENTLKIFKATLRQDDWDNIEPLPFNSSKYSVGHPSLSSDGKKIYFVSNMPGGMGGSDIYVSYNIGGRWSNPINLGANVNTKGDEIYPFIFEDSTLYFSSDGHSGLGKLDIFAAKLVKSEWKNIQNLGSPVNSLSDDFAYVLEKGGMTGFLSSNRGSSDDNIFRVEKSKPACDSMIEKTLCYTFYEKNSIEGEKLPLAYEWDLGDGTKKRGLEVKHCYETSGNYKIQLNIIDSITGNIFFNEATYEIKVDEISQAYIEYTNDFHINNLLHFDAGRSRPSNCKITEYVWSFGDGNSAIGQKADHEFQNVGFHEVSLLTEGKDSLGMACSSCVYKTIHVTDKIYDEEQKDSASLITDFAKTLHTTRGLDHLVYKIQLATSEKPLSLTSDKFKGLKNVQEYQKDGVYGYTVGAENELLAAYPLYIDIVEKGFDDAQVVAFKEGKLLSQIDTSKVIKDAFTHLSGRIINRFGDPVPGIFIIENLNTGKIINKIKTDSVEGRYQITLPNDEIYGYYSQLEGYYSISNFIDLRKERRNLEIKKNIEMIGIQEFNEENLSVRINNLFFQTKEFNLSKQSYPELNRLARLIKSGKNLKVEISGHTDNVGDPQANLALSQKRADSVKNYLVSIGCKKENIISLGYGLSKPLVNNETERGRYLNRRVEFKFIKAK